ncbi:MAG: FtsB family cell division protein [Candidatus Poribacteria bacterium]
MLEPEIYYSRRKKASVFRILLQLIISIIATMMISFQIYTFGGAVRYWQENREKKQKYIQEINDLEHQQNMLKKEILELKNNKLTQERLAREMGYIKPGEVVYKFIDIKNNDTNEK